MDIYIQVTSILPCLNTENDTIASATTTAICVPEPNQLVFMSHDESHLTFDLSRTSKAH